jgi:pimeloyl-ACP methyl ester carboxylesterase
MIIFLVGFIIFGAAVTTLTYRGLTRPPRRTYASAVARSRPGDPGEVGPADGGPLHFEEWDFQTGGVNVRVWDIRGDAPDGPCFILTHGWGDSKIGALSRVAALRSVGSRFIAWDLRGHGESGGTSALGAIEDSDLIELIGRIGTPSPLVLLGWSMGAGISIEAASRHPEGILAVIAEAPYRMADTPARNMLRSIAMPSGPNLSIALSIIGLFNARNFFARGSMCVDRVIPSGMLRCPLLVLHGEHDDISPLPDGVEIAAAAKQGTFVRIDGAAHDGLWTNANSRESCVGSVRNVLAVPLRPETSTIHG